MSFSGDVKDEIVRHIPDSRHCLEAEIAAIIRFAGTVNQDSQGCSILIETENVGLAKKYLRLIRKAFDIHVDLNIRKKANGRGNQYSILLTGEDAAKIREAVLWKEGDFGKALLEHSCCRRAFIRGAFLASGSMSNPDKSYHFEIVCKDSQMANDLKLIIATFEIHAKIVERKSRYIVYLKDSTEIVDILNVMEAHQSLMELENIRIIKDMRNCANRQYNCDSANINKMVQAAARQLEDIHYIQQHLGLDQLPPTLREMAQVRLEYPDVSLQELGSYLDPPVGKSGVNHRLRKLGEIAQGLKTEQEK
jgi:hypothetical protein